MMDYLLAAHQVDLLVPRLVAETGNRLVAQWGE